MISIISSTNRKGSLSEKFAIYYASLIKVKYENIKLISLKDLPNDSLSSILFENNGKNEVFNKMINIIKESKKLVFIIPEYNGSFPGVLKVFIDALNRDIVQKKKCALIGLSSGIQGCALGLSHFTDILHYLDMHVLPLKLRFPGIKNCDMKYILENELYVERINKQINEFLNF